MPAALALSIALAGCLDVAGDEVAQPNARDAPADDRVPAGPQQIHVALEGNAFVGAPETIRVGDQITWTHRDGALTPHTVTTDADAPEVFDSSPTCTGMLAVPLSGICMTAGDTFSHTFTVKGTYRIYCKPHGGEGGQGMSMTVIVAAQAGAAAKNPVAPEGGT